MAHVMFVAIVLIWSVSFLLMKKATVFFSPASVAAWRLIGGAVVVTGMWWWRHRILTVGWRHALAISFIVVFGFAAPFILQPFLVAKHGSAFVGMTVGFVPLLTLIVSIPMLGILPTVWQMFGVTGALGLLFLLFYDGLRRQIPTADFALAGTVPLGYAVSNVVIRRWLREVPAFELTTICLTLSAIVVLPLSVWQTAPPRSGTADGLIWSVLSLVALGIVGTGIAQVMFNRLIQERGPLFAGMISNLVPLGAVLWGWLDSERISPVQVGALIGISLMVLVVQLGSASTASHRCSP